MKKLLTALAVLALISCQKEPVLEQTPQSHELQKISNEDSLVHSILDSLVIESNYENYTGRSAPPILVEPYTSNIVPVAPEGYSELRSIPLSGELYSRLSIHYPSSNRLTTVVSALQGNPVRVYIANGIDYYYKYLYVLPPDQNGNLYVFRFEYGNTLNFYRNERVQAYGGGVNNVLYPTGQQVDKISFDGYRVSDGTLTGVHTQNSTRTYSLCNGDSSAFIESFWSNVYPLDPSTSYSGSHTNTSTIGPIPGGGYRERTGEWLNRMRTLTCN